MRLLASYVAIVIMVGFVGVQIGFQLDRLVPTLAVPLGLGLFFGVLIVGWPIAVFITERWFMPEPAK